MTMRRTGLFLILGLIALLPTIGALGQNQRVLVVRGGLLIDGTGADPVPNSVVVVANGKIQSVGREGSVTIPANATVIDAAGKTIIPGLVDSHVHLRNYHVQDYLYWGVTTVGDLGNSPGWLVAYRDAIAQGRMPGSYVLVGGNRFNAPLRPEFVNEMNDFMTGNAGNAVITDIEAAEREVEYAKKIGQDGIKMRDRLTPEMMKTIIGLAHKRGLPVFAHFDSASTRQGQPLLGTDEIVDTGLDVHVHLFGLIKATAPKAVVDRIKAGGPTQGWEQLDTSKFGPIVQKMVANKMFLNPTIANQFQTASKYLAEFDRINTQYVNSPMGQSAPIPVRDRYARSFKRGPEQNATQLAEGYRRAGLFVKQFADAGGKLIAGTDSDAGRIGTSGITLHEEMAMFSEIGVPPMKIIQSATSWGMEAWGKAKEAGTVEQGKRADLVVLNKNPLDDIRNTMDINTVIQGGNVVDREALAKRAEVLPRPGLLQEGFANPALKQPFIDDIMPELISTKAKNPSQMTIRGHSFSKDSFVLLSDQVIHGTVQGENMVRISLPASIAKAPGAYPLVVVDPGNGGGISNTFYLIVNAN